MSWLLKNECKYGGDVLIIEYKEEASRENNYKSRVIVSHGGMYRMSIKHTTSF